MHSSFEALRYQLTVLSRFHSFFGALDNQKNSTLMYLSSGGPEAVKKEALPAGKGQKGHADAIEGESSDDAMGGLEEG